MEINDFVLKLTGTVSIPESLEIDTNYSLALQGSIIARTDDSNENGTISTTFKFRPVKCEILTPLGKTIKARDKRKLSQKLRGKIWLNWNEKNYSLSEEEFYEKVLGIMIRHSDEIIGMYEKEI